MNDSRTIRLYDGPLEGQTRVIPAWWRELVVPVAEPLEVDAFKEKPLSEYVTGYRVTYRPMEDRRGVVPEWWEVVAITKGL